ncbi:hypothetical protein KIW84_022748 [Lathyrus oleraceus]|uniref:Uncharacterized protein n=1 Tax=Pisum sativum TaxID=3888 RepID=A0A9D5BAC5_PEA|nr:hypothetical protein KIW84_022748 [Pisum sativum]
MLKLSSHGGFMVWLSFLPLITKDLKAFGPINSPTHFESFTPNYEVVDKGYSTTDHVKKIISSLPVRWRPMVISLKLSKDLNNISLEELVSSLRNHEIELEEDEP